MTQAKIRVLNDHTINKIAAGEVIENPASVVKELVENSIDAGASSICVEIQEGGRQLIRISDDGCGMVADDAILCLERHATSKIREVEDIQVTTTMGFRGEAIPSIAAISKFSLLTAPRVEEKSNEKGTLVIVDGGRLLSSTSAARSPGTTIEVKSLFFNVPVRRKFQKSPTFDHQEITKMISLLALANPTIQFELISDQKTVIKTTPYSPALSFPELLYQRIESVLGSEFASSLIPLQFQQSSYELTGYIGSPTSHRPNRKGQYLFINQRSVYSHLISSAFREGYGPMLPNNRHPFFVLHLRMPGTDLDINVHPQKREVRLRQETQLKEVIIQAVQKTLRQKQNIFQDVSIDEDFTPQSTPISYPPFSFPKSPSVTEEKWEFRKTSIPNDLPSSTPQPLSNSFPSHFSPPPSMPQPLVFDIQPKAPSVLATLFGYCVLEPFQLQNRLIGSTSTKREGGLLLLDQRAAYSRIHYEKLLKRPSSKETQPLLIPLTLHFSPNEFRAMREFAPLLNEMGFGLREFGQETFLIDAYPQFIKEEGLQTCIEQLLHDLIDKQASRELDIHKEAYLALMASKASLPTAKRLSLEEAQELVTHLLACEIPSQCPFGKSTCLYLSPEELAKWFQKHPLL